MVVAAVANHGQTASVYDNSTSGFTSEQQEFFRSVRQLAKRLAKDLRRRDRESIFDAEGWRLCAELGIQGLPIPEEYGGHGQSFTTSLAVLQALGEACPDNGLLFSLNAQIWSVQMPLLHFGTEEQRRRYLPAMCQGTLIGAHAMVEPDAGSDAMSLRTRAILDGDSYLLRGSKIFVTNGPLADFAVVFATVRPELKSLGVTAFLVDRDMPGVRFGPDVEKMGMRTSPLGELFLDDVRVPIGQRLGPEGGGLRTFQRAMEYERAFIFAAHLGAMRRLYGRCREYARTRQQFGQPISKFPAVADRLIKMRMDIDLADLLLRRVAEVKDAGGEAPMQAAMAKLFISEAWVQGSLDAIQIFGAYGYTTEYEVEREHRDAVASRLYSGTSEIQRKVIAHCLGL